ncbi:Ycf66 family protein, partial [Nodularia spumigena CS-587/03]|nr:Ycf66 family protein [Nodularia spumigena CS-587/03]
MVNFGLNSATVLAQVNFGTNSASILGIFLAVSGAALYFLRTVRPELSRDQDIFFAAVGLLCGFILIFQGWRLDPILQFNQLLLVGSAVFFAVESIRLRGIATQQAKRNTPIVDDEREVSRNYSYNRRGY